MHVTCTCIIIHVLVCTGITLYMYTVNTLHTLIHRYLAVQSIMKNRNITLFRNTNTSKIL